MTSNNKRQIKISFCWKPIGASQKTQNTFYPVYLCLLLSDYWKRHIKFNFILTAATIATDWLETVKFHAKLMDSGAVQLQLVKVRLVFHQKNWHLLKWIVDDMLLPRELNADTWCRAQLLNYIFNLITKRLKIDHSLWNEHERFVVFALFRNVCTHVCIFLVQVL